MPRLTLPLIQYWVMSEGQTTVLKECASLFCGA